MHQFRAQTTIVKDIFIFSFIFALKKGIRDVLKALCYNRANFAGPIFFAHLFSAKEHKVSSLSFRAALRKILTCVSYISLALRQTFWFFRKF